MAYFARTEALEGTMKAIDGDARPSVVQDVIEQMEDAQNRSVLCITGLIGVGSELGAEFAKGG